MQTAPLPCSSGCAGKRLLRVIEHNEGGANKDLAKFADQINALCDKWDR